MRRETFRALAVAAAMLFFAVLAWALTPTLKLVDTRPRVDLETLIPQQFGDWHNDPGGVHTVVNPQQEVMLRKLYSQTLSRTYVNKNGQRVMLALAYGEDQRDSTQLHYPEVCYPAQGFELLSTQPQTFALEGRALPVKRLSTALGSSRKESVTYWVLIGDVPTRGGIDKKLAEMRFGVKGYVPDGLLFRVSSIESDPAAGYRLHDQFATALLGGVSEQAKTQLIGRRP